MLAHDITGTGPVSVALLHGVGGGKAIWDAAHSGTAQALADAGYRVIALDLPGYGASSLPAQLTTQSMAQAVIDTLRTLDVRPAVLLGHSMGGMVAQEIVATDPLAACGLVLACTSPAFGKPEGGWQQAFLRDRLAPLDAGLGMPGLARQLVAGMVGPNASPEALAAGTSVMGEVPQATYRQALQAIVGFDRRQDLPAIQIPALCLASEWDRTAPPAMMVRMCQRIPAAQYTCIADAGHLANVEQPQAFAQAVIHFLQAHFPRTT